MNEMMPGDWAVVVGVEHYPRLRGPNKLQGPENDARAICEWLCDESGGNLGRDRVKAFLSSELNSCNDNPRPTTKDVDPLVVGLQAAAMKDPLKEWGRSIYTFVGMGFALRETGIGRLYSLLMPKRSGLRTWTISPGPPMLKSCSTLAPSKSWC